MEKNKRIKKILIIVGIVLFILICLGRILQEERRILEIKSQIKQNNAQIDKLKEDKKELQEKENKINDYEYIEDMARSKLDMFYPNEKVYVYSN